MTHTPFSSRLGSTLGAALLALFMALLAACSSPSEPANSETVRAEEVSDTLPPALPPPSLEERAAAEKTPHTDTDTVSRQCQTDSDCVVKNVGNCCGYYPACVNKDSPTFPERVKAECAEQGLSSVCGFPEISSCECSQGQCRAKQNHMLIGTPIEE